jgi:hypothetical protein
MRPIFRIDPRLPVGAMKTYAIVAPVTTHFRPASCAEVDCDAYRNGWTTVIDTATDLGGKQANYIRLHAGRHFRATEIGGMVTFTFPPGQSCFRTHQVRLDRPEHFLVRDGDWRGNPRGTSPYQHTRAADWVDDFANHQQRLADRLNQG